MTMPLPVVPEQYQGGWQRTLYAEPNTPPYRKTDTTTKVVWLQGQQWHADLRIPADAPDFSGIQTLEACSRPQLEWMASLTAFAGLTQIEGGVCTWHRFQDICPSLEKDVGLLRWLDGQTVEEQHPAGHYVEDWQRLSAPSANETIRVDELGRLRWLALGDHAIAITPRPLTVDLQRPFTLPSNASIETLRWRVSLCFDYCQRQQEGWRIELSTQPWRKGCFLNGANHSPTNAATTQL
tara:strand:- start:659 stop:1372 length:714 start_codon:yes stop_codon:yes gene_type:complete